MPTTKAPRVLLIASDSSYRIQPFLRAARELEIQVLLAAYGAYTPVNPLTAEGIHIDLREPRVAMARLRAAVAKESVDGVVATDDAAVELASSMGTVLGLPHNPASAARLTQRKDLARQCLVDAGIPSPASRSIDLEADLRDQLNGVRYPCVLKPLGLSASRGVMRADSFTEVRSAARRLRGIVRDLEDPALRTQALVEAFIPGPEFALEAILTGGRLQVLALFDKPDPLNGPYFEETYYTTPSRYPEPVQQAIIARVEQACAAYGLCQGPVHAEVRLHQDEVWLIELAARTIGGQCARLLDFDSGHSLEHLVLANAIGSPLAPEITSASDARGVLMIPIPGAGILRRVEGVGAASRVPGITDIEISQRAGQQLVPLPEGGSYLGFIFARGLSAQAVEEALREAHACLNIVIAPFIPITAKVAAT